jgi:phosphatidylinositol kinase/protein kinase (PI-3  family)
VLLNITPPPRPDPREIDLCPLTPAEATNIRFTRRAALYRRAYEDRMCAYLEFSHTTVQCFLAARAEAFSIFGLVEPMLESGLPCFKPSKTLHDLRIRFAMGLSELDAASVMCGRIRLSQDNMRTNLYDRYQNMAEGIEW